MKVAVLTTSYPVTDEDPSGHFVRAEVEQLRAAGHAVEVVHPKAGGAFGWPGAAARLRDRPWLAVDVAGFAAKASLRLRAGRFEYVVAHWAVPCGLPIALGALPRGTALELVSHGADVRFLADLPRPVASAMVKRLAQRATAWRFVSERLMNQLLFALPRDARNEVERVALVRPAALAMPDARAVEGRAREIRRDVHGRLLVTVGRLIPSKRVDAVLAHARSLRNTTVAIVGDGPEREHLEALARDARRHGSGNEIVFTGLVPRTEALAWIRAADEVVHASTAEGLSTVMREAEALGVPVRVLA